MSLAPGNSLGPYGIVAKLGSGGMGEVYRATDTKLGREVAIKVLPAGVALDAERLSRFKREAQLLASLNHPNIAAIHGLDEAAGTLFLVLELAPGEDLSARLTRGPIPVDEALEIARQIALALEEAHDKGIVHRDLKPANVKLTPDGKVKVLDFGLAKAYASETSGTGSIDSGNSPTMTHAATMAGMILGTAAYMSPEQARGKNVDKRADIWAFGVVLYEMLTGAQLFDGETVSDTLAAVLTRELDMEALPTATPPAVRQLLRRCLERNPKNRLHDIADARIVIDEIFRGGSDDALASQPARARSAPRWLWPVVAVLLLAVGVGAGRWSGRSSTVSSPLALTQFDVRAPEGSGFVRGFALSPDGRRIAFAARGADGRVTLWVRNFESLEARPIPETAGARFPFWAPDSRRIGFFSPEGLLWTDVLGGSPLVVATTSPVQDVRGAAWGADDVIVYAPTYTGPLFKVTANGGPSEPATRIPDGGEIGTHRFPSFLPDGRRFVFYAAGGTGTEPGSLYLGRVGSLDTRLLGPSHSTAVFAPPGYLIYARGESIVAHRFDEKTEAFVGEPVPVISSMGGSLTVSGLRSVAVAGDGALIYRNDKRGSNQIVWVDRTGKELDALPDAESTWHYGPRLSPDGRFLGVSHLDTRNGLGEIWVHDLARNIANRLTLGSGDDYLPTWVRPDGREIVFSSGRPNATGGIYRIAPDQPGEGRVWLAGTTAQVPSGTTPDGSRIAFERTDIKGKVSLWIRDRDGEGEATRLGPGSASEFAADLSPDGRWIAYVSDVTRSPEIYIRRLDGSGAAIRISNDGGFQPLWRRDGRELFYVDTGGRIVAVPVAAGDPLQPGAPSPLFNARLEEATDRQYDISLDGQRFLLNRSSTTDSAPITVVLDWTALLERKSR
jgi:Tol biopolymer transport system component